MRDAEKDLAAVSNITTVEQMKPYIPYWIIRCLRAEAALRRIADAEDHGRDYVSQWLKLKEIAENALEEAGK